MRKVVKSLLLGGMFLVGANSALAEDAEVTFNVTVRPGVTVNMDSHITLNPSAHDCDADSVVLIHGLAHTGTAWGGFAQALFADPKIGHRVSRTIAIDLPGHGQSGLPEPVSAGVTYGSLGLDDYTTALVATLKKLNALGLGSSVIIGHSMGGLLQETVQNSLISSGSSLADLGFDQAISLEPSIPAPLSWAFLSAGGASALLPYILVDPVEGEILRVPPPVWDFLFFTTPAGTFVPGTPDPTSPVTATFISDESLTAAAELTGFEGAPRPVVAQGIFDDKKGTQYQQVIASQDIYTDLPDAQAQFQFLTNDKSLKRLVYIQSADAVHDLLISNPAEVIGAIKIR